MEKIRNQGSLRQLASSEQQQWQYYVSYCITDTTIEFYGGGQGRYAVDAVALYENGQSSLWNRMVFVSAVTDSFIMLFMEEKDYHEPTIVETSTFTPGRRGSYKTSYKK